MGNTRLQYLDLQILWIRLQAKILAFYCQSLLALDQVSTVEPKNVMLKILKSNYLIESIELELSTDGQESISNVDLTIDPS